jgi:hypothetical protein
VTGIYILLGGIVFFAGVITALDWYARHRERPAQRK